MWVDVHRQQGLEYRPECIGNPVASRHLIPRRPGSLPFLPLCRCHIQ
jgi:hypothetical protein